MKCGSLSRVACALAMAGLIAFMALPAQAKSTSKEKSVESTVSADANEQPVLQSTTGLVADADSGQIYYEKGMHTRMFPASITKILTALVSVEKGSPSDVVTVPQDVVQAQGKSVANIALVPGDTITLEQLEYTMFLASANDSAVVIADHIGGSVSGFVDMMNEKAAALGATDSHFSTPNGLPDPNNYTTAYDMALIARAAAQNPTVMRYFGARTFTLPASALRKNAQTFTTLHKMMKKTAYYDADVVAGKTGWETMSGNTLVTIAKKNGRTLVAVVMNGVNSEAIYGDTQHLLNYAFAQPANPAAEKLAFAQSKTADIDVPLAAKPVQKPHTSSADGGLMPEVLAVTCLGLLICTLVALVCWRVRRRGFLE
ncbi:MAG: D-alanyl-D-alanine carboxypeptidase family protein [Ethanoligenens sp.]|uniref:D-alanyl-D-alanine carboxypeptidase family protein n=1 Tax=Ethanoligenens sp. TaxID=2099655 RepID=UPI0039E92692